jgi:hypothetical protein
LEKVVARIGTLEQETVKEPRQPAAEARGRNTAIVVPPVVAIAPTLSDTVKQAEAEAGAKAKTAGTNLVIEEADRPVPPAGPEEILLEPGAERPRPKAPPAPGDAAGKNIPPDIRANLIAAARRAAQSAAAEAANSAKKSKRAHPAVPGGPSLAARMVQALDKKRRPILFGLAAIVLTLGAVQTIEVLEPSDATTASGPAPVEGATEVASAEPQPGSTPCGRLRRAQDHPGHRSPEAERDHARASEAKSTDGAPASGSSAVPGSARQGASLAALPAPEQGSRPVRDKSVRCAGASAKIEADKGEAKTPAAPTLASKADPKASSEPAPAAKADPKTPAFVAAATPQPPQPSPAASFTRAAISASRRSRARRSSGSRASRRWAATFRAQSASPACARRRSPATRPRLRSGGPGRRGPRPSTRPETRRQALRGGGPARSRAGAVPHRQSLRERPRAFPRDIALAQDLVPERRRQGVTRAPCTTWRSSWPKAPEASRITPPRAEWFRRAADLGVRDSQFTSRCCLDAPRVRQDLTRTDKKNNPGFSFFSFMVLLPPWFSLFFLVHLLVFLVHFSSLLSLLLPSSAGGGSRVPRAAEPRMRARSGG